MSGFDLHIHSTASDGKLSPTQVVEAAAAKGLLGCALTDHDTLNGVAEAHAAAERLGITLIAGVELSAEQQQSDVHILGYWLDERKMRDDKRLAEIAEARRWRLEKMVERLTLLGMPLSFERICEQAGGSASLGRPHIAEELVACGYCASIREAFGKWLGRGMPAYVARPKLSPLEAVDMVLRGGGVPVLAHPGLNVPDNLIPRLVEAGIGGIEVYHPEHDRAAERKYAQLARRWRLAMTGGSDYHVSGVREIGCRITTVTQLGVLAEHRPRA
ncbi:MAG: PHP domain-containing protein [Bacillota bacterium]|nr:PHP domain-containing protein [Bacillota bacterium]